LLHKEQNLAAFVFSGVWITDDGSVSTDVNKFISKHVQKRIACQHENPGSTPPLLIGFANLCDDMPENQHKIRRNCQNISIMHKQVCRCLHEVGVVLLLVSVRM